MTRDRESLPGTRFVVRTRSGARVLPRHPETTAPNRAAAPHRPSEAAALRSGFVALLGRPNVGKSSLTNRLVGERVAIVSDKPQTTRRRITAILHLQGAQIVLQDTPGLHKPRHVLGRRMKAAAVGALEGADVVCLIVDASAPAPGQGDRLAARHVQAATCPRLLVLNKIDLVSEPDRSARQTAYRSLLPEDHPFAEAVAVSAETGEGMDELVAALLRYLPAGPAYFPEDVVTDQPEQFLAAEFIREQALARLRDEVPHSVAVTVDEWKMRDSGLIYIGATLYVERDSQKGIVIGAGGAMLRDIGQAARQAISLRLGSPVYLDLWVKVKEDWRDRPGSIETLGLGGRQ